MKASFVLAHALGFLGASARPTSVPTRGRYNFAPHQNKRERRRRMRQAFSRVLSPAQFWNKDEWREAREMHLVVLAAGAKGL